MTIEEIANALKNYKKGTYLRVMYKKQVGEVTKVTTNVVRLVNYYSVVKKEPKASPNFTKVKECSYLKENNNTHNVLIDFFTTKCKNHHAENQFFFKEYELITKEEAQELEPKISGSGKIDIMFSKNINDIIAIF